MRIPKTLYDPLKQLERQEGETTGISIHIINDLLQAGLVLEDFTLHKGKKTYRVHPSLRGMAALADRPLDPLDPLKRQDLGPL